MELSFETARLLYKPTSIKCLFIAEAPPQKGSNRFFYFENVLKGNTLYLETMKALFPNECMLSESSANTLKLRSHKNYFLSKFMAKGFFLDDASMIPMPLKPSLSQKKKIIKSELPNLKERLKVFIEPRTPIILISSTVYEVCSVELKVIGLNILNDTAIPFPIGFQNEFKDGIIHCLRKEKLI